MCGCNEDCLATCNCGCHTPYVLNKDHAYYCRVCGQPPEAYHGRSCPFRDRDPEPRPGDGPEYHADHQYWLERHPEARDRLPCCKHCESVHASGHTIRCKVCENEKPVAKEINRVEYNDTMNQYRIGDVPYVVGEGHTTYSDKTSEPVDTVNHPPHYNNGPKCECGKTIECIDITRHHSLLRGTAIKYLWRADYKGSKIEDLQKAIWYIQKEIDTLDEW